jgi:hypothetical protein
MYQESALAYYPQMTMYWVPQEAAPMSGNHMLFPNDGQMYYYPTETVPYGYYQEMLTSYHQPVRENPVEDYDSPNTTAPANEDTDDDYPPPRPRPEIVDEPLSSLSQIEKSEYRLFKDMYRTGFTEDTATSNALEIYQRVYDNYARYAGIPDHVRYTLDHDIPEKSDYDGFTRYHQSYEWDCTSGWSPNERISIIDEKALSIASDHRHGSTTKGGPKYIVLMHCIPGSAARLRNRSDNMPVPCFETMGDILYSLGDDEEGGLDSLSPPKVMHTLRGEFALCGYKRDGSEMLVRGRQDVGRIYDTICNRTRYPGTH